MPTAPVHEFVVRPLTDADREQIAEWTYPGELAIYDPGRGAFDLHPPDHVALASPEGSLLGYGTSAPKRRFPVVRTRAATKSSTSGSR